MLKTFRSAGRWSQATVPSFPVLMLSSTNQLLLHIYNSASYLTHRYESGINLLTKLL